MKKIYVVILFAFVNTIANAQYHKLLDFAGTSNGSRPYGSLISDGTFLYGMTYMGGTNNDGIIFKIKPDGTGDTTLLNFAITNGRYPLGSLISDGTFLYGMTYIGGANDSGAIFKILPDGTGYSKLFDFSKATGYFPHGSLISDGTFLYGMTLYGGTNGGVLFRIKPDGTGDTTLFNFYFNSSQINGNQPYGSLMFDGTFLYGMTELGGQYNNGNIFKINTNGTGYTNQHDFGTEYPTGSLISDGTFLYGMTPSGGIGYGTIFKIKPNGTGFSAIHNFGGTDGWSPLGDLIFDGTFLYGMTSGGGINDWANNGDGVIFKIKPDGTGFSKLLDFAGATNGRHPNGSLVSDGTFLYGMTQRGGAYDGGTIFKFQNVNILGNLTICSGQNATLTASGGATYSWNTGATTTSIIVTPTANTTYSVTATSGTCVATATNTVTINSPLTATISISGVTTFCQGNSVTLNSNNANSYLWSTNATTQSIVVNQAGSYSVVATNACGSSNSPPVSVTVNPLPTITVSGINTICNGQSTTLTASGANTYVWAPAGSLATASNINPAVTNTLSASTNFTVTGTDANSCTNSSTNIVTVNLLPIVYISPSSATICSGVLETLSATSCPNYTWSTGATTASIVVVPTITTSYTVSCTNPTNGCTGNGTGTITVQTCTGISQLENDIDFTISPNPTTGIFTIQSLEKISAIQIVNLLGEKVYEMPPSLKGANTISVSLPPDGGLGQGIYFLQLGTDKGVARKKIVISH